MLSFDQALQRSTEIHHKRHVLLGNGFSIACRPDCFAYGRILDEADLDALSVAGGALFYNERTTDFEQVIRALRAAARMAVFYKTSDATLAERLTDDAERLKEVLATTLAKKHPDHVGSITNEEYETARRFLSNFGHFFSLNYDLLLYWALMQEIEPDLRHDDGFRDDPDDPDAPWVAWNDYNQYGQDVYFLHGGLHLYADGATLKKLTFKRTGVALVEQIRAQLDEGAFPLIVTEGTSEEKHAGILHHAYLAKCLRSMTSCEGSLFIHGHSLAENDHHVLRAIIEGKFKALFISIHEDPESESNQEIRHRAELLAAERPSRKPLSIDFYDAATASVWA
jgi:hypothetical protein